MTNSFPEEMWASPKYSEWGEGFWARARVRIIRDILRRHRIVEIIDVGSGNGQLVSLPLSRLGIAVTCVEPLPSGAKKTRELGLPTIEATLDNAGLAPGSAPALGLFDVIEDSSSPEDLLIEAYRILAPGGIVIVSAPAHAWLFSDYDEAVGTLRRYSKKSLSSALLQAGFQIRELSGVFSALVPYALVFRRIPYLFGRRRTRDSFALTSSRAAHLPVPVSFFLENLAVLDYRARSPIGLSIVAVGYKAK